MRKTYNTFLALERGVPTGASQTARGGGRVAAGEQLWAATSVPKDPEGAPSRARQHFDCEIPHPGSHAVDATAGLELDDSSTPERDSHDPSHHDPTPPITRRMAWNLFFCVLAWACTVAGLTLVVGTSNVVLLSIGGDPNLSSVPLATFFLGSSLVSLLVTPWLFRRRGRRIGFLCGVAFGLVGSALGAISVLYRSSAALISATASFGAAVGIGFHLRFAALEVATKAWAERAVTLVVTGGSIAAFAGPESAEATRGLFGDKYEFLGVFVMTGAFNIANGVFTCLVHFASNSNNLHEEPGYWQRIWPIFRRRHFIVPVLISTGSWIIMALPMSVLRVVMHQVGFTSRQSLIVIELHFLGMYSPGFFSGQWIAKYGPRRVSTSASLVFLVAFACLQLADGADESSDIVLWILGMVAIGVGWNFAFSASTVGLTRSYTNLPECKSIVQAANDGLTFLFAGALICCASFIYRAGGEGLEGWWTVNWVALGFIVLLCLVLFFDAVLERSENETPANEKWSTPSAAFVVPADSC